ncbi:hypothetical protein [Acinetobacter indicus]|uniref:hypothetical protein n=1 Tax=Acinetobacter indicus TaxID=756892 RepID=UPI000CEC84B0|nr:hypothetical protein [Acinetobacter indicus]
MSSAELKTFIENARGSGATDTKIFLAIMDSPKFKKGIERGNAMGMSNRQIAAGLGLNIPEHRAENPKQEAEKAQAQAAGKTQFWQSGLLGMADIGVPVVQAAEYAADGIRGGINKVFGANLDTNRYEKLTKTHKDINKAHNDARKANNQGMDIVRMGTNMLMTAPLASTGGVLKAGTPLASKAGVEFLAKNAALGGLIGATGVHENNTQRLKSMGAGALGGAIGAGVGYKAGEGVTKIAQKAKSATDDVIARISPERTNQILQNIDDKLDDALKLAAKNNPELKGVKLSDLSDDVVRGLRADARKALQSGKQLSPEAVARKAVLEQAGIKGTKGQITGDAKQWQQEAELAKIQGVGDDLREKFISDNKRLAELLDIEQGATGGRSIDQLGVGRDAAESLLDQYSANKQFVREAYNAAKNAPGNDVLINGQGFSNDVFTALDDQALATFLPADIRNIVKQINDNPQYFTLRKGEELIKVLNNHYKSSMQMGEPTATTHALGVVRQALQNRQDEALQGLLSQGGNDAAQLYQFAREAHKTSRSLQAKIPLLQDVLKQQSRGSVNYDDLYKKHILNGKVDELAQTIGVLKNTNPQAVADIQQEVIKDISAKAVNANGQFSPAGMKRALDALGDRKLNVLFSPDQVKRLKNIREAGHYAVTQPAHAAVNNSNTASGLMNYFGGILKNLGEWGQYVPVVGNNVVQPVKGATQRLASSQAINPKVSLAGSALPPTMIDNKVVENLIKLGVIGGANLPDQ